MAPMGKDVSLHDNADGQSAQAQWNFGRVREDSSQYALTNGEGAHSSSGS